MEVLLRVITNTTASPLTIEGTLQGKYEDTNNTCISGLTGKHKKG
jgi:hypothetical protein